MSGRVYDPVKTVCQVYSQVGSVRRTAKELKISEYAVCKCLITDNAIRIADCRARQLG